LTDEILEKLAIDSLTQDCAIRRISAGRDERIYNEQ